ncbi:hypothetical protein NIES22_35210 [Calothrix brevissima NIES-22]|nr:hypothetical protein NIES22_35210 [Calothrix brevissima NIES-22]
MEPPRRQERQESDVGWVEERNPTFPGICWGRTYAKISQILNLWNRQDAKNAKSS